MFLAESDFWQWFVKKGGEEIIGIRSSLNFFFCQTLFLTIFRANEWGNQEKVFFFFPVLFFSFRCRLLNSFLLKWLYKILCLWPRRVQKKIYFCSYTFTFSFRLLQISFVLHELDGEIPRICQEFSSRWGGIKKMRDVGCIRTPSSGSLCFLWWI